MDSRDPVPCNDDRVLLPLQLRQQLIQFYHDQVGHPGITRTLATIKRQSWWPGMRDNIETYIQSCQWCAKRKVHHRVAHIPIAQYPAPRHAFEICHLDLTGQGLPATARGNRYILVFKCSLTRYVELVPIPNKKELTIARVIVDRIYCRHGAPGTIITDRGTEFTNELLKQICILLSINRISTTGGNPRSNGLAENHNIVLKDMLSAYTNIRTIGTSHYLMSPTLTTLPFASALGIHSSLWSTVAKPDNFATNGSIPTCLLLLTLTNTWSS